MFSGKRVCDRARPHRGETGLPRLHTADLPAVVLSTNAAVSRRCRQAQSTVDDNVPQRCFSGCIDKGCCRRLGTDPDSADDKIPGQESQPVRESPWIAGGRAGPGRSVTQRADRHRCRLYGAPGKGLEYAVGDSGCIPCARRRTSVTGRIKPNGLFDTAIGETAGGDVPRCRVLRENGALAVGIFRGR